MRTLICLSGLLLALASFAADTNSAPAPIRTGVFPFFKYADHYEVWEYIPLDQGGRHIQLQLIGSERDADVVAAVRRPGFFSTWGDPLRWDSLETSEPEKSMWLNRWYILPCFAREYYLTHDRAYLTEMLAIMRKWRDENPAPTDLNAYFATKKASWRDMQVAWRMQNLAWCYFLGEQGYTPAEKQELFQLIQAHARVLLAWFGSQPLSEGNHQSHGATAMLYAALLFPDLENASELRATAFKILNHHLDKAFYDDGNSVEFVPGYYPFFTSIFRDAFLLCRSNNVPPPPRCEERLRQFYDYLRLVKQPNELMPPINDSTESSATVPISTLAELLQLPDPPLPSTSHWFNASHQAVMRDRDAHQPGYVFLDAGPQVTWHWHGGKLGFHLWYWDKALLCDSGVSDYDDPLRKSWYTKPEAHNTILVDGAGDYDTAKTSIRERPFAGSSIDQWESNERYDWAVMRHTGFASLKDPVSWTRHFIMVKGVASIIVDQLESSGDHDYTWLFHLLPCTPKLDTAAKSVFTALPTHNLLLLPASPQKLAGLTLTQGTFDARGKNASNPVAHYDAHAKDFTQTFLLAPIAGTSPSDLHVEQSVNGNTAEIRISGGPQPIRLTLSREGVSPAGKYHLELKNSP